tara:strand:- start:566 stop:739 length:174 start_codon:yes stop_codon:yes gene_type:complete
MEECEKDYYIESALAFLLITSELLGKSNCEHNSITDFIKHLVKCNEQIKEIEEDSNV